MTRFFFVTFFSGDVSCSHCLSSVLKSRLAHDKSVNRTSNTPTTMKRAASRKGREQATTQKYQMWCMGGLGKVQVFSVIIYIVYTHVCRGMTVALSLPARNWSRSPSTRKDQIAPDEDKTRTGCCWSKNCWLIIINWKLFFIIVDKSTFD